MKTANEAWPVALKEFSNAYGVEPDLNDEATDKPVFLGMLEQEIRKSVKAELAVHIADRAERLRTTDFGPLKAS